MDIVHAGLKQQPFRTHDKPVAIIHYRAEQAAHDFLHMVAISERGIGPMYGPPLSGKKTIIRHFLRSLPPDIPAAIVDGTGLNAAGMLDAIRSRFGLDAAAASPDDSMKELQYFIAQHARRIRQPLLIVENFEKTRPGALLALCMLAVLRLKGRYAIRMILVSNEPSLEINHARAMSALAARTHSAFELGPMTLPETTRYVYTKLRLGGCANPDTVLPDDICAELHQVSGGWPGRVDDVVSRAIERAENRPIRHEHIEAPVAGITPAGPPAMSAVEDDDGRDVQKLYLTLNRRTLGEFELSDSKTLIGRSVLCDVNISSRFVSKHHALIVRTDGAMHLVDLKSTNGTFVNSRRIQSEVLRHEDVISLGNHGIKLISPAFGSRAATAEPDLADTATMKTLAEMRRLKARPSVDIAAIETGES